MKRILHPRGDAADLLSISLRKLDSLIKSRTLKVVRIGRRTLVPNQQLVRFAARGTGAKQTKGARSPR